MLINLAILEIGSRKLRQCDCISCASLNVGTKNRLIRAM